jgi:hypothetical protein
MVTRMNVATAVTSMKTYRENRSFIIDMPLMPISATRTRLANRNLSRGAFRPGPAAMSAAIPARPALIRSRRLRPSSARSKPMALSRGARNDQSARPSG